MKKSLLISLLTSFFTCSVMASSVSVDLTPTGAGTTGINAQGITAADVFSYNLNEWHGTWESSSLNGQVGFSESGLALQIGAVASNNSGGNYAGLKFDLSSVIGNNETVVPSTLTFNWAKTSQWGASLASFSSTYSCTVYGFSEGGSTTVLGSWEQSNITQSTALNSVTPVSITFSDSGSGIYDSYGLIFRSMETSTLGSAAGLAIQFTDIKINGELIPEPATTSLSLLCLLGLSLRRKRTV